jgi:ribonuclease P protein component
MQSQSKHTPLFNFKLCKEEIVRGKTSVQRLFASKTNFFHFPFKVLYLYPSQNNFNQILVSVPKKNFKKSTDRNYIRRLIKESYRLNKNIIPIESTTFNIAFVYVHNEILSFEDINKKMQSILKKIVLSVK